MIVTVSVDQGLERFDIYDEAITHVEFNKHLRKQNGNKPLAIFMDKLQVHRSKEVKEKYIDLDIMKIENVSYSPEFNPIEACFSQVKR